MRIRRDGALSVPQNYSKDGEKRKRKRRRRRRRRRKDLSSVNCSI